MAAARKFKSIQAVVIAGEKGVGLIAVADDGTAWTARTHSVLGHVHSQDLEWKQITDLPVDESLKPVGLFT